MPPKRRRPASPVDTLGSKKRTTRSSSKPKAQTEQPAESEPAKPTTKTSKPAKPQPTKEKGAIKFEKQKQENVPQPSGDAITPTTLTIQHDSVKSPVTCHHYISTPDPGSSILTLIFTHGAGGTLAAPAVVNFCTGYSSSAPVLAFQGSMNLKARTKGFHACTSHLDLSLSTSPLVLGGRSMGARAAVLAGTELLSTTSSAPASTLHLILVSYPLKGPKDDIRDRILLDLPASVRVLFVVGDRDAMCPLDLLNATRREMQAKSQLVAVKGADHGMHVKPAAQEKWLGEEAGRLAASWVDGEVEEDVDIG